MSVSTYSLTLDEIADAMRHYLYGHSGRLDLWAKLTETERKPWRDRARTFVAGAETRRAEIAAVERRRG